MRKHVYFTKAPILQINTILNIVYVYSKENPSWDSPSNIAGRQSRRGKTYKIKTKCQVLSPFGSLKRNSGKLIFNRSRAMYFVRKTRQQWTLPIFMVTRFSSSPLWIASLPPLTQLRARAISFHLELRYRSVRFIFTTTFPFFASSTIRGGLKMPFH